VLGFFLTPAVGLVLEFLVVREDIAQVGDVVAAVRLDQRGGLHGREQRRLDHCRCEPIPGQIGEFPVCFHGAGC